MRSLAGTCMKLHRACPPPPPLFSPPKTRQIRPLEDAYKFGHFFSPLLSEGDFEAKPSVLLLGQYSTGKSTFIKYLLQQDYPGIHIGPEPTTDRWAGGSRAAAVQPHRGVAAGGLAPAMLPSSGGRVGLPWHACFLAHRAGPACCARCAGLWW
jgi:hypothetical protein